MKVQRSDLESVKEQKMIRRIDGNHRLAMAETLEEDEMEGNEVEKRPQRRNQNGG